MRLTDLVDELSEELKIPKVHLQKIIISLERKIHDKLVFGLDINIYKVGTISQRIFKARKGYNIQLRKFVEYPKKYQLHFKPSESLNRKIKKKTVY